MWIRIVYLTFGALLLDPVGSEASTCKTIEISRETDNFTATIHSSSFDDRFYSCVWLKNGTSGIVPEVQWTGRFRIVFARYRAECANATVRTSYTENGVLQSTDIRSTAGIGNDPMSHTFSKKVSLDSNSRVGIFLQRLPKLVCTGN